MFDFSESKTDLTGCSKFNSDPSCYHVTCHLLKYYPGFLQQREKKEQLVLFLTPATELVLFLVPPFSHKTNSMEKSNSSEAAKCLTTQEILPFFSGT
jgi:hypothetical protein